MIVQSNLLQADTHLNDMRQLVDRQEFDHKLPRHFEILKGLNADEFRNNLYCLMKNALRRDWISSVAMILDEFQTQRENDHRYDSHDTAWQGAIVQSKSIEMAQMLLGRTIIRPLPWLEDLARWGQHHVFDYCLQQYLQRNETNGNPMWDTLEPMSAHTMMVRTISQNNVGNLRTLLPIYFDQMPQRRSKSDEMITFFYSAVKNNHRDAIDVLLDYDSENIARLEQELAAWRKNSDWVPGCMYLEQALAARRLKEVLEQSVGGGVSQTQAKSRKI